MPGGKSATQRHTLVKLITGGKLATYCKGASQQHTLAGRKSATHIARGQVSNTEKHILVKLFTSWYKGQVSNIL